MENKNLGYDIYAAVEGENKIKYHINHRFTWHEELFMNYLKQEKENVFDSMFQLFKEQQDSCQKIR